MKLHIIRHGDPDYARDTLTERGWREAELLAERTEKMGISAFYVSPLGRAQDTASLTLRRLGTQGETLEWLREFAPVRFDPDKGRDSVVWDWLPARWKRWYRINFAMLPVPVLVFAVVAVVLLVYQFITADLQAFIYFQF